MQRKVLIVERRGAAVDLRIAQRVRQDEVVICQMPVVVLRIDPEFGPICGQPVPEVVQADTDRLHEGR